MSLPRQHSCYCNTMPSPSLYWCNNKSWHCTHDSALLPLRALMGARCLPKRTLVLQCSCQRIISKEAQDLLIVFAIYYCTIYIVSCRIEYGCSSILGEPCEFQWSYFYNYTMLHFPYLYKNKIQNMDFYFNIGHVKSIYTGQGLG